MEENVKKHSNLIYGVIIVFIVLLLLAVIIKNNYDLDNLKAMVSQKNLQISNLNKTISDLRQKNDTISDDLSKYKKQINFMNKYVAICPVDGKGLYHIYDCPHYDTDDNFYVFNIGNAERNGFYPCKYCEEDNDTTPTNSTSVYVTSSGKKYHRSWCSYLNNSKKEITLEKAIKQGYTPCSRCNP